MKRKVKRSNDKTLNGESSLTLPLFLTVRNQDMKKFINPLDPDDLKIKAAIQQWASDFLKLNASTAIDITEHLCTEVSCVHAETVIKLSDTEGVRFFKIAKPLTFIRKVDVQNMTPMNNGSITHKH